jgi:hypothetical protein
MIRPISDPLFRSWYSRPPAILRWGWPPALVRVTDCDNSPELDTSIVALYADGGDRTHPRSILAAVEKADASLAMGEGRTITTHEGMTQLVSDVKRRGMARLSA